MDLLTKSQLADLRYALLGEAVNARTVALSAEMLLRRVIRTRLLDFEVSVKQADDTLSELHARGFIRVVANPLGDTPYYQATPEGELALRKGA